MISFVKYDLVFLEKSWQWLTSEPVKTLQDAPDFSKEQQLEWYHSLQTRTDYFIEGITFDSQPIGAWGLKNITDKKAEYFGYIGEIAYWGQGIGKVIIEQAIKKAKALKLEKLYLVVLKSNARAIGLYKHFHFEEVEKYNDDKHFYMELGLDVKQSIKVVKYDGENQREWDEFIDESKNGTFMLKRGYVEYHSDRFSDFSLMFYEDGRLIAVMPGSLHDKCVCTHGGLTYGGIVSDRKMTASKMLEVFDVLKAFLKENGILVLVYKRVPSIYYTYPSDEDLYALFRNDAKLVRCDISTAVYLPDKIRFSELRRRGVKKALKNGLEVRQSFDYDGYVDLLTEVLSVHHDTKPVHTGAELALLASRFPDVIKLYCAYRGDEMMAGVLIFDTPQVVHAQYIANSEEGRNIGALDLVMDYLINTYSEGKTYFDFGISTENLGKVLNYGLISQKEMFGGRGIIYDFYEWNIQ